MIISQSFIFVSTHSASYNENESLKENWKLEFNGVGHVCVGNKKIAYVAIILPYAVVELHVEIKTSIFSMVWRFLFHK